MATSGVLIRRIAGGVLAQVGRPYARNLPMLAIGLWFAWLLVGRLQGYDLAAAKIALSDIRAWQWIGASLASAISFVAVAGYDVVTLRALGIRVSTNIAMRTGFVATSLAQLVGLGLASGSLARWRILDPARLSLWQASILTIAVTTGFLATAAVFAAFAALLWLPIPPLWMAVCVAVLLAFGAMIVLSVLRPKWIILGRNLAWPRLITILHLSGLSLIDMGFAAFAFWLLFPPDMGISLLTLLPVFLLATGVGILSGVPGGVGPFELTCLAFLSLESQAPLLAAIFGFRVVYYLLPGIIGFIILAKTELCRKKCDVNILTETRRTQRLPKVVKLLADQADRAEARLIESQEFDWIMHPSEQAYLLVSVAGNSLIALSDPVGDRACWGDLIARLRTEASAQNLTPVLYKCGAGLADCARDFGLSPHLIGQEAWLDPQFFTLEGRAKRGLRRKLKSATEAGLRFELCDNDTLPLRQMQEVSDQWAARRGGARGFSMGRFRQNNTNQYRFYLAWQGGRLVGFVGLWHTDNEVALDLMRSVNEAPCGTMHALVYTAIKDAASQNCHRFSLASVPFSGLDEAASVPEKFCRWLHRTQNTNHGAKGLYQFKQSFRPNWEPRFLASTHALSAAIAGIDISRRIIDP
jgi:phosphatidylglycerol lysyltransferase